jgi:hypothetical protein
MYLAFDTLHRNNSWSYFRLSHWFDVSKKKSQILLAKDDVIAVLSQNSSHRENGVK